MFHGLTYRQFPSGLLGVFDRSRTALSLADCTLPDTPLVLVNDAFCTLTGYPPEEALGKNCRFLQGDRDCGPVRMRIRQFLADPVQEDARFAIPNVTREGEPFLNIVYMAKIRKKDGTELILGSQFGMRDDKLKVGGYEAALGQDLVSLGDILREDDFVLLGSMEAVAQTAALLARYRLEG